MSKITVLITISMILFFGFACDSKQQTQKIQTKTNQGKSTDKKVAANSIKSKKEDKSKKEKKTMKPDNTMMDMPAMRGPRMMGMLFQGMYNPKTVTAFKGEILAIEKSGPMMYGLKIKSDKQIVYVHLGPAWYIEKQNINFQIKDKVEVKGSKNTFWKTPVIMAAEIKKGDQTLNLFNKKGFPAWMENMPNQGMMMEFGQGQGWMWGPGMMKNFFRNMHNPRNIETIKGEVIAIENSDPMMSGLKIKTGKDNVYVHLGPLWYLEKQKLQFKIKDQVEVKGSKMNFGQDYVIMANEIKKGDQSLTLFDKRGYPFWMDEMHEQGMMMGQPGTMPDVNMMMDNNQSKRNKKGMMNDNDMSENNMMNNNKMGN